MSDEGFTFWTGIPRAPQRGRVPWFEDVLEGMAAAPTRLAGVVRARIDDDGGTEFSYRVARDGHRVRCSALDGAVHVVASHATAWLRHDGRDELRSVPIEDHFVPVPDDYEFGVRAFDWSRWDGNDFTQPVGGPDEILMLARPAWRITLAPPPHKPEPMQIVIDQQTFTVLHEGNEAFATCHEWTEISFDPDLDEQDFTWRDEDRLAARYE